MGAAYHVWSAPPHARSRSISRCDSRPCPPACVAQLPARRRRCRSARPQARAASPCAYVCRSRRRGHCASSLYVDRSRDGATLAAHPGDPCVSHAGSSPGLRDRNAGCGQGPDALARAPPEIGAARVRQQISAVLSWAVGLKYRSDDPCGSPLKALLPGALPESEYHRALPYEQVPALDRARVADRWIGERLLLEFLVLTAVRTNEARGALWSEIDWDGRKWTIPGERMKERKTHEVPLSSAALAVLREARHHPDLEAVRQRCGEPDLVFPTLNGRRLYNNGLAHLVKALELDCVPHGFRSSFSTWSAESGHDFALAEICLSHAVGSEVARRYRRSGLFKPRIPIMEEWGRYVASARSVIPADSAPKSCAGLARGALRHASGGALPCEPVRARLRRRRRAWVFPHA